MIDKETAIAWAKDAGANVAQLAIDGSGTLGETMIIFNVSQFQSLIASIQNKAFEQSAEAALKCASCTYVTEFDRGVNRGALNASEAIRALKQEQS